VNGNNTLEEEIRERIAKGNKTFCANKTVFKSKLVSRKSRLKLFWSVIRPSVVYGCETWVLKESIIQKMSVFERKIFGPNKENNGIWRIETNKELDELTKQRNIINYVKAERLSWFGHINGVPETSIVKRIYKWKPFTSRPVGREDDVRNDLEKTKLIKWTEQAQDRLKWKVIVEKAKTLIRVEEEEEGEEEGGGGGGGGEAEGEEEEEEERGEGGEEEVIKRQLYIYSAVLKHLTTSSDFHTPLSSIVPFAHS
jgi:hypothetical protein